MSKNLAILSLFICFTFGAFARGSSPADTTRKAPTWAPKKGPYRPTRALKNDILHTQLEMRFDWLRQHALGSAIITFKPYFYPQSTLELDAKGLEIKGIFHLDTLARRDSTTGQMVREFISDPLEYTYDKRLLTIKLRRKYSRFDTLHVLIDYVAKPNELPDNLRGPKGDKGLYFINADGLDEGKPQQIWTQGETEYNSCWLPMVDSPNEKMTQDFRLTVENRFKTISNGKLISSTVNPDSTRTDRWVQKLPHAPYLAAFIVGNFAVEKETLPNGLELSYYVEPEYGPHAKAIFGRTKEMIAFFEEKFGVEYQWDKYAQVAVRDFVAGAMENTSITVHAENVQTDSRALLDGNSDNVIAHELMHHWFGNLVTCESWVHLPLNEAFANYSEYLWNEHKKGTEEADLWAQGELQQYLGEAEQKQEPLIRYHYTDSEDMFDSHSYAKGGRVLHMLRKYVGDEAFFTASRNYLIKYGFGTAEINDLREAFEEVTGEDLNWFFNQWFLSSGHANLKVEKTWANGKINLKINQLQDSTYTPIYRLPLKVDVWVNGQKKSHDIVVNQAKQTFEFPAPQPPDLVDFDVEKQILGEVDYEKSKAEWIFQYNNCDKYLARYEALTRLEGQMIDSTVRNLMMRAMSDKFWKIRQLAVSNFSEYDGLQFNEVERTLQSKARVDPHPRVRMEAIITLASFGDNTNDPLFREALNDSSYQVVSAALDAYLIGKPDDAADVAARFENAPNSEIITAVANYYAGLGKPEQYDWFIQKMNRLKAAEVYNFLQVFGKYLIRSNTQVQRRALPMLETTARNAPAYFVRFGAYQVLGLLTDIEGVKAMRKDIRNAERDPKLKEMYGQFADF
ncbi:M1 family metallopeptidase [Runella sp. MFBS21]|uniref:M1 family metallopeptidase n=1 Tax=Runella sp. MFBS21 TaxID=3034018 RepID=UPI0023F89E4E|nr:M1 family metallopeptidase [Runella sp. MFBS21]MDF7818043.1 M1 family metallopeptidase [Runella sp. MFBS21]